MQNIKNIIFDLGGVILDIDYNAPILAFERLGIENFSKQYSQAKQTGLFDDIETGKIASEEFINKLLQMCPSGVTRLDVVDAWNSILLRFPINRLQILQQLQNQFNIFLLSNTNEIHEQAYNKLLQDTCGYPSINVFFDKAYLSHRIGMRKPNPQAFELILNENKLLPEQTLFIDDSIQHIESAKKLGIKTIFIDTTKGMTIEKDIFKAKNN